MTSRRKVILQLIDRKSDASFDGDEPDVQFEVVTPGNLDKLADELREKVSSVIVSTNKPLKPSALKFFDRLPHLAEVHVHDMDVLSALLSGGVTLKLERLVTSVTKFVLDKDMKLPNLTEILLNARRVELKFFPEQLPKLEKLSFSPSKTHARDVEYWGKIANLKSLTQLRLSEMDLAGDFALPLPNIESLTLSKCGLPNFNALSEMSGLRSLWLLNPKLPMVLSGIESLGGLEHIRVQSSKQIDLTPLKNTRCLKSLTLSRNSLGTGQREIEEIEARGVQVQLFG